MTINTQQSQLEIEKNYPRNIQKVLENFKDWVTQDVEYVLSQDDFVMMYMYLSDNYNWYTEKIPEEIVALLNNQKFIKYVNDYIKCNIDQILKNDWIFSFEEISLCLFVLWFWKFYWILKDLNNYDDNLLWDLFDYQIEKIIGESDYEKRENYYTMFLNLSDLINTLCILNEVDSFRKILIPKLVKLLNEKTKRLIINLKSKNLLTDEKKDQLDYIIARSWINFAHVWFISLKEKTLEEVISSFSDIIKKQIFSYNEALETNFWWVSSKINNMQSVFLWNIAYVILVMISKIKQWYKNSNMLFNEEKLLKNAYFQELISDIFTYIPWMKEYKWQINLDKLELICHNIFSNIYFDENYQNLLEEGNEKKTILHFISNPNNISSFQIEIIHHLIMFLNLSEDELLEIWNFLLKIPKFNNYNFEFYKLKIFDLIVSKFEKWNINPNIKSFLSELIKYVEQNKIASQLLYTYSRLYLTIAYHYVYSNDNENQNLAMEYFSMFSKMNWDTFEYEKYWRDLDVFYYKIGSYKLNATLCDCDNIWKCWLFNDCNFKKEQVIKFWLTKLLDFQKNYETSLRNELDESLSKLLDDALSQNWTSDLEINKKISEILSNKIFHWIAESHIIEVHNKEDVKKKIKINNWISIHVVDLFNGYKLLFTYPKIYNKIFNDISEKENSYIIVNIKNIITSYLKRRDSFLDHWTWLPNEAKLKTVLLNTKTPISFINIKLSTIKSINNWYSYDMWDEYMYKVSKALQYIPELEWNIFRLSWAKFWIIINDENKIDDIISRIKNIKIKIADVEFKLDFFMWVVINETDRIVEKSSSALSYAKKKSAEYAYYSDEINDLLQNKQDLDYLAKLDNAIEEDRVIPFFQPIFDTKTWKIIKYEALMRVKTKDWKIESPYLYLESAKKFWRLNKLAYLMIEKVFLYASENEWNYSINISWDDLWNKDLLVFVSGMLEKYKISSKRITFEILEWEWDEENKNIKSVIALKNMWFRIAMDDFWANNSNINRLIDFLSSWIIDDLKIDWKMIKSLEWENTKLKQELDDYTKILIEKLEYSTKLPATLDLKSREDKRNYLKLLLIKEKISKKQEELVNKNFYLDVHINWLNSLNTQDEILELIEEIKEFIDREASKLSSVTKKMLSWIVDAANDSWVKLIAEFVESERIKLTCDVLWIDALQWYHLWKPTEFTK